MKRRRSQVIALIATTLTWLMNPGAAMAIEQPDYEVVETLSEDVTVRHYPGFTVATTRVSGEAADVGNLGFRRLATYIFGGNQAQQKIAMTAPVIQQPTDEASYEVAFFMPGDLTEPPTPDDDSVLMKQNVTMTVAVLRYRGGWSQSKYEKHLALLQAALDQQSIWVPAGPAIWARYDPPFKPWFLRTNEVMIPVERRD